MSFCDFTPTRTATHRQQKQPTSHLQQISCSSSLQRRRCRPLSPLLTLMLLMLAAFPTTLASSRESDAWDKSRCPAWLSQYEQWHATTKGTAGAKYLIADAPGFVGVGDHLRGFMFALRVAAATDRVLLLRWEHPGNLTDFLVPGSSIDWASWEGTPAPALLTADKNLKQSDGNKLVMGNNDLGKLFPDAKFFSSDPAGNKTFLVLKTNQPAEQRCEMCPSVVGKPSESYDYVCMFRFLFTPSQQVQRKTDEVLHSLYPNYINSSSSSGGSSSLEYQAVHLRLGQMKGESAVINRLSGVLDPLGKLLLSVSCGSGMAEEKGIDTAAVPLLLLADHRGVRQFSRHGKLSNVVTPAYEAVHTKMNSVESHLLSFVDLNLIARAKCMVLSHSGFSNVGWWMSGGNDCRRMMAECYKQSCGAAKALGVEGAGPYCP